MAPLVPTPLTIRLDDVDQFEKQELTEPPLDLESIPACIRRYIRVFDIRKCGKLLLFDEAKYTIELLPGIKPLWQKLIPISPIELKALEEWLD